MSKLEDLIRDYDKRMLSKNIEVDLIDLYKLIRAIQAELTEEASSK